ncbi:glycoside hydrolase family 88 protein [Stigmatella sp. ncwal1]|uniref:Glycoside hydrolase family 88 protein n=1 Tax=Stigmatella ashevillensis TaxID=2995309 RepID=A0ABT5D5D2_9BACT|nr:glycoside hydrolase family 88 protein [Stigmatella ashevillena]MDC0707447.1 glycoside hydrolase family 88 protein [Stigmatella ashevillena]
MLGLWCVLGAGAASAFDEVAADRAMLFAQQQLVQTASQIPTNQYPKNSLPNGTWRLISATDLLGWTQGFFPGELWYMYQQTGLATWRMRADAWTRNLEGQKSNMLSHDLGFKFIPSYALAYQLTGDDYYRQVLLTAAGALASRYNPRVGIISCCDWNPDWQLPLVVDTMMNLELLLWGAENGGQAGWRDMAVNHALRTLSDVVRPDGSTFHVADYVRSTGTLRFQGTYQGYSNASTWTRGQAWAVYGYTLVYRYTRDPRMLEAAQKVTDYYLSRLPADGIPPWDFDAPASQMLKDSSAAAAVASALLELTNYVPDASKQSQYWNAAMRMLDSLSSPAYLAAGTNSPGILLHGVGHYPAGQEVDVSLSYGDYYFIEALRRFKQQPIPPSPGIWYSKLSFAEAVHELGVSNSGIRSVEFDVTPLDDSIDGVIGYADSATSVTAYSQLSMLVRLNPNGWFDVFNGTGYAAANTLLYVAHTPYHVRISADLDARQYSVWVRPLGGSEILLADRYAFRATAPPIDDLGKAVLKSGTRDNEFRVANHTVNSVGETWYSRQGFFASLHSLGTGNTGIQTIEFDVRPLRSPIDGVIGYADSSTTVTERSHLAMSLHMSLGGIFEAYNGSGYAAVNRVPYALQSIYHVRMRADIPARTYSIWIRPPGGGEILLADRYAFRVDAPPTDDLGFLSVKSTSNDDYWVANHTVRSATGARLTPLSEVMPLDEDTDGVSQESAVGCSTAPGVGFLAPLGVLLWLRRRRAF